MYYNSGMSNHPRWDVRLKKLITENTWRNDIYCKKCDKTITITSNKPDWTVLCHGCRFQRVMGCAIDETWNRFYYSIEWTIFDQNEENRVFRIVEKSDGKRMFSAQEEVLEVDKILHYHYGKENVLSYNIIKIQETYDPWKGIV